MKQIRTDEDVEREIARLQNSEAVKLARKEEYIRNRRRQYMYTLLCKERRGLELMKMGYRLETLEAQLGVEEESYE